jgi:putative ABC transport system ATP-binding protein
MEDTGRTLEVRNVSKVYRRGAVEVHALRGVSFNLGSGEAVAIMGPSGSGKTTLLNILAGLDRPSAGDVLIGGVPIGSLDQDDATVFRRQHIGFVFQFFNLLPTMSARDNISLPLIAERLPRHEVERRTSAMLEAVGLADRAEHRPSELSGGEQQRVAIARALVMRPHLLLADEPTGNLDTTAGGDILTLLSQAVRDAGLSVVLVTHSTSAAASFDRVLRISDGRLLELRGPRRAAC